MMKKLVQLIPGLLIPVLISAQSMPDPSICRKGKVLEGLSMKSLILKEDVNYSVYLPPDYEYSERKYPVLYLLHGYSDNETAWVQYGEVNESADRAIEDREIPPMIIVMPNAGVSWYINDYKGEKPYEDMIFKEFIPFVEQKYRIRSEKEFRAVGGLSMGGYGSLIWALHHPEMFSACIPFSAGVLTSEEVTGMDEKQYQQWFAGLYGNGKGEDRLSSHWKKNSVLELMKTLPVEQIEQVDFYIDCGDDDFLFRGNSNLHILMSERGIDHEYRVRDGAHNWFYWRSYIKEGLKFAGEKFHR